MPVAPLVSVAVTWKVYVPAASDEKVTTMAWATPSAGAIVALPAVPLAVCSQDHVYGAVPPLTMEPVSVTELPPPTVVFAPASTVSTPYGVVSHTSPVPSPSVSVWLALASLGQLSTAPQTPSPSTSLVASVGHVSQASPSVSLSVSV